MFISLLFTACSPSLTCQFTNVGPRALRYHGIDRVAEHAAGTPVEAAYFAEVTGFFEVTFDEPHVPKIIQLVPDGDSLRGKTTIGKRNYQWGVDLQHPTNFAQQLHGLGQVIYRDADPNPVELRFSERQSKIRIQVLHDVGVEPLVAAQLHFVHTQADDTPVLDLRRQMAYPTAHEVQNLSLRRK